jgi:hypothetical protein
MCPRFTEILLYATQAQLNLLLTTTPLVFFFLLVVKRHLAREFQSKRQLFQKNDVTFQLSIIYFKKSSSSLVNINFKSSSDKYAETEAQATVSRGPAVSRQTATPAAASRGTHLHHLQPCGGQSAPGEPEPREQRGEPSSALAASCCSDTGGVGILDTPSAHCRDHRQVEAEVQQRYRVISKEVLSNRIR